MVGDVYNGVAKSTSLGSTHTLGHGVGLTIGERLHLTFGNNRSLKRGDVVITSRGLKALHRWRKSLV